MSPSPVTMQKQSYLSRIYENSAVFDTLSRYDPPPSPPFDLSQSYQVQKYLQSTDIIDWQHPAIVEQAHSLAVPYDLMATARLCFTFVRDRIPHSCDFQLDPATCRASEVLLQGTGFCYAKSHLLAALLRANGIPAGFCYQRLSVNDHGPPYSLHGYNAVHLPQYGWYRVDARGNKVGVDAQFAPPFEQLAFPLQTDAEYDFESILPEPLACVVEALQVSTDWRGVLANLPDIDPGAFESLRLKTRRRGNGE